jgi:serine/threonine-protein kinase
MDNPTRPIPGSSAGPNAGPPLASDLTGKTLGDFHILRRLGEGGMGQVYLSEQRSLKRPIALKILKADLASSPTALKRFKAEAEAVARATHPNIVQVYAIGDADGLHYMALEYVDGLNLRDYLSKKGPPPLALALSIMRQGAAALQRAAELGIIHRDIKPENILLTRKGAVKIADFGLSRCLEGDVKTVNLTQSGVTMGTPLYMSPEQVEGKPLDPRTDIYSFGVTCYHMLAGHPPFRGETAFEVALQHVQGEAEPLNQVRPDLPPELAGIVHRMTAKRPEDRYQTGRELIKDLNRLRDTLSGSLSSSAIHAALGPSITGVITPIHNLTVTSHPVLPTSPASVPVAHWPLVRNWLIAFSLVVALAAGVLWGWRSNQPLAPAARQPDPLGVEAEIEALSAEKTQELQYRMQMRVNVMPRNWKERGALLRACMGLGVLYLEQGRLGDADQFFSSMIDNPPSLPANDTRPFKEYTGIGQIGRAMVLAFRNQAEESVAIFQLLVNDKDQTLGRTANIINNRAPETGFLRWIVKALDYDAANYEAANKPFPPKLQELRKARPLPAPPPLNPNRQRRPIARQT